MMEDKLRKELQDAVTYVDGIADGSIEIPDVTYKDSYSLGYLLSSVRHFLAMEDRLN